MKEIKLSQGKVVLVDDEDYDYLNQWKWYAKQFIKGKDYYVTRNTYISTDPNLKRKIWKTKSILMHRVIMKVTDPKIFIDHINHNSLDNRKSNLRTCTHIQNMRNRRSKINSLSKYLGVSIKTNKYIVKDNNIKKIVKNWRSTIYINNKNISLGSFPFTPEGEVSAAKAYDKAAKIHHGEFANLNFKEI